MAERRKLPDKRCSWQQKFVVHSPQGWVSFHAGFGEYEDGSLGEVWIDFHRAGSVMRDALSSFCKNFSIALQFGAPLHVLVDTHRNLDDGTGGFVTAEGSRVTRCTSIVNCVMQEIANTYILGDGDEARRLDDAHRQGRGGERRDGADAPVPEREAGGEALGEHPT